MFSSSFFKKLSSVDLPLLLGYLFVWILFFFLFPVWIALPLLSLRILFFLFLHFLFLFGFWLLVRLLSLRQQSSPSSHKYLKLLFFFLTIAFLLELPSLFYPITSISDEISNIGYGIYAFEAVAHAAGSFLPLLLFGFRFFVVLFTILGIFIYYHQPIQERLKNILSSFLSSRRNVLILYFILLACSFLYFFVLSSWLYGFAGSFYATKDVTQKLFRVSGGVLAFISIFQVLFFGHQEAGMRFSSLLFYLISPYYFYKLVSLFRTEKEAFFSALLLLFAPAFFYAGHLAYATTELVFIVIISSYFLFRYLHEKQDSLVYTLFFWLALGFLYDRKAAFFFITVLLFVLCEFLFFTQKRNIHSFLTMIKPFFFGTLLYGITILPYVALRLSNFFNLGLVEPSAYQIHLSQLFNSHLFFYAQSFPYLVSSIFAFLLIPAGIFSLWRIFRHHDRIHLYLLILFFVHYLIYTTFNLVSVARYFIPVIFVFVFLVVGFFSQGLWFFSKKLLYTLFALLVVFFVLSDAVYNYTHWEDRYLPFDQLFSYIQTQLPPHTKILKTLPPSPYNFYITKHGLNLEDFDPNTWVEPASAQTLQNLHGYMLSHNLTYAIFPLPTPAYEYRFFYEPSPENATWLDRYSTIEKGVDPQVNHAVITQLYALTSGPFIKVAEFHLGNNILFISSINATYTF